ncbi:hypothetical protein ACFL03_16490, partial [Thermodesulfobacteriota bacterium]
LLGSGLEIDSRGLAVNPRSAKNTRFEISTKMPEKISRPFEGMYKSECKEIFSHTTLAMNAIFQQWQTESRTLWEKANLEDLQNSLSQPGLSKDQVEGKVKNWIRKVAKVEFGETWEEDLDATLITDD